MFTSRFNQTTYNSQTTFDRLMESFSKKFKGATQVSIISKVVSYAKKFYAEAVASFGFGINVTSFVRPFKSRLTKQAESYIFSYSKSFYTEVLTSVVLTVTSYSKKFTSKLIRLLTTEVASYSKKFYTVAIGRLRVWVEPILQGTLKRWSDLKGRLDR